MGFSFTISAVDMYGLHEDIYSYCFTKHFPFINVCEDPAILISDYYFYRSMNRASF